MKKLFAVAAVSALAFGLVSCSSGDASENRKADISNNVTTLDEAWEQLDELNYAYSKVGDAEWIETASPMLVQCPADNDLVQIAVSLKGVTSADNDHALIAEEIAEILENSGLETQIETEIIIEEEKETPAAVVYASTDDNLNLRVSSDTTGYIDVMAYSKCVEGDISDPWTAPGRTPIEAPKDENEIVLEEGEEEVVEEVTIEEEVPAEEVPAEEEAVVEEEVVVEEEPSE